MFIDPRGGREDFGTAIDVWIDRHAVTGSTHDGYRDTAGAWVKPAIAGRTLAQASGDRGRAADLLVREMGHLFITQAYAANSSSARAAAQSRDGGSRLLTKVLISRKVRALLIHGPIRSSTINA